MSVKLRESKPRLKVIVSYFFYSGSGGDHLKHRPVPDLTLGTPFNPPEGLAARLCWFIGLPINIAYYFTIPDVKKESCHKWVAVTFIACIFWIGVSSYTLVWMVTIIGYTFGIPDAIMGLTLVAFGSSIPDCSSSLFIARKGRLVFYSTSSYCWFRISRSDVVILLKSKKAQA